MLPVTWTGPGSVTVMVWLEEVILAPKQSGHASLTLELKCKFETIWPC